MNHVALLRAVNLGGHNRVRMADLRSLLAELGLEDPRSLRASGNLVFGSAGRTPAELESLLEAAAADRLGLDTDIFVRTAEQWSALVEANPFPDEAEADPSHLLAMLLKEAPAPGAVEALRDWIPGRERIRTRGRVAYVVYPDGIGRSRLTTAKLETHLDTSLTGRNWNTVVALEEMAGSG